MRFSRMLQEVYEMPSANTDATKHLNPLRLVAKLALAILLAEAAIMFALNFIFPLNHEIELLLDPLILVVILTPILYFYVLAPMRWAVTREKTIEGALYETEERFRALIESAGDAVVGIEPPGVINLWNRKAEELFGYSQAEALGKETHALIVPTRYREAANAGLKGFFMTGNGKLIGKTVEVQGLRRNGSEFGIELSISAVNIKGVWNAIAIARDITERKRLEGEAGRNLDEAERMNRLMVGRELKMEELRKEVRQLRKRLQELENGQQPQTDA